MVPAHCVLKMHKEWSHWYKIYSLRNYMEDETSQFSIGTIDNWEFDSSTHHKHRPDGDYWNDKSNSWLSFLRFCLKLSWFLGPPGSEGTKPMKLVADHTHPPHGFRKIYLFSPKTLNNKYIAQNDPKCNISTRIKKIAHKFRTHPPSRNSAGWLWAAVGQII